MRERLLVELRYRSSVVEVEELELVNVLMSIFIKRKILRIPNKHKEILTPDFFRNSMDFVPFGFQNSVSL